MNEQDLILIWQLSSNQKRIQIKQETLVKELKDDVQVLTSIIKRRDKREIIAAIILVLFFGAAAVLMPSIYSKTGSIIIALTSLYIVKVMNANKKELPADYSEPLISYLQKSRGYLTTQKHILDTVWYWYIAPLFTGGILFTIGMGMRPWLLNIFIGLFSVLSITIYFLNVYSSKTVFAPKIEAMDELIADIEEMESE